MTDETRDAAASLHDAPRQYQDVTNFVSIHLCKCGLCVFARILLYLPLVDGKVCKAEKIIKDLMHPVGNSLRYGNN